jgi:hypothetical protein
MSRQRRWSGIRALIALLLVCLPMLWPQPVGAQPESITFPETGKTLKGIFLTYWWFNDSYTRFGLPISDELQERSLTDGKSYTMQYFERAVLELHPENQAPYNVLLSLLGTFLYKQKYPHGADGPMASDTPDSLFFPETGKHLGCLFLDFWQRNGELPSLGYPISDELVETEADGSQVRVQYFQRAVLKYNEKAIARFKSEDGYVMLPQVGLEWFSAKYGGQSVSLPTPTVPPTPIDQCATTRHGPSISEEIDDPPVRASVGKGVVVTGRVRSSEGCKPIENAKVVYWLAGPDGQYDPDHEGKVFTDSTGSYRFETNFPGFYGAGGPHVHLYVEGPGHKGIELEIFVACGQTEGTYDVVLATQP